MKGEEVRQERQKRRRVTFWGLSVLPPKFFQKLSFSSFFNVPYLLAQASRLSRVLFVPFSSPFCQSVWCTRLFTLDCTLQSRIAKNPDVNTGPLARPFARLLVHSFARLLTPLTHLLAPNCSLCSRGMLRSLLCLLAHSPTLEFMGK